MQSTRLRLTIEMQPDLDHHCHIALSNATGVKTRRIVDRVHELSGCALAEAPGASPPHSAVGIRRQFSSSPVLEDLTIGAADTECQATVPALVVVTIAYYREM
jgi:hypothetical protein